MVLTGGSAKVRTDSTAELPYDLVTKLSLNILAPATYILRPEVQGFGAVVASLRPGRGRPRGFDPETALAVGQRMFHAHGYEGVGLAALTDALGIKPPSFYMAFGSKAGFFAFSTATHGRCWPWKISWFPGAHPTKR